MSGCLNFSKLKVGQKLLGVIKAVNDFDMIISLPNQLTGFVSCDRVSSFLSSKFAAAVKEGQEDSSIPSLTTYYQAGELVVATIAVIESTKGSRRRIELSLRPDHLNKDLTAESLQQAGVIVMGEVKSHEDRGYTIDFGAVKKSSSEQLMGFLPDGETSTNLVVGKSCPFLVNASFDLNRSSRVTTLTANPKTIAETLLKSSSQVSISSLLCGTQVQAEVKSSKEGKLIVVFAGHEGRIDILNLPDATVLRRLKDVDLVELFPVGKRLVARIVHVDVEEKHFHLSCIQSIVNWRSTIATVDHARRAVGKMFESCPTLRVDVGLGVLISLPNNDSSGSEDVSFAYVHISRLSDERIERIEGAYKVGTKHQARIVDYDAFTGLYQASLQASILKESIFRIDDLHPGQVVRGEVTKIEPFGVLVAINERIRAICPLFHLSEVQGEQALRAFHVGQKYKFRVIDRDPKTRRITLSRKKGLLDSPLPVLSEYTGAVPGNLHDGYIVAIKDFGCIVRFYGDVKGIITVAELADEYIDRPQDSFFVGQVLKCRVVKCDPGKPELVLSLRKQSGPKVRPEGASTKRKSTVRDRSGAKKQKQTENTTIDDLVTIV